jgi:hypothetical protein
MPSEDKPSFTKRCRQIAEELERSAKLHPREIQKKIEQIERELVTMRDELILHCRQEDGAGGGPMQAQLEQVNVALSLVVAVEYPVTSIQRSALKQSHELLKKIC